MDGSHACTWEVGQPSFFLSGDDKFSEVKSCIMKKKKLIIASKEVPLESKNVFVITRICCQDCILIFNMLLLLRHIMAIGLDIPLYDLTALL